MTFLRQLKTRYCFDDAKAKTKAMYMITDNEFEVLLVLFYALQDRNIKQKIFDINGFVKYSMQYINIDEKYVKKIFRELVKLGYFDFAYNLKKSTRKNTQVYTINKTKIVDFINIFAKMLDEEMKMMPNFSKFDISHDPKYKRMVLSFINAINDGK